MIEQCVRVTRVSAGRASIESLRDPADCSQCAGQGSCRHAWLWRLTPRRSPELVLEDGVSLRPGDALVVAVEERALLRGVWLLYGVPLCGLLAGTVLGSRVAATGGDGWPTLLLAASGLLLGGWLGRFLQRRASLPLEWRRRAPAAP